MMDKMTDNIGLRWYLLPFFIVFMLGWIAGSIFSNYSYIGAEKPLSIGMLFGISPEISSPSDHISEGDIHVSGDRVVIDVDRAQWASFTDTNSMDPFIDVDANSIEIKPETEDDVKVGDVISFRTDFDDGLVIHRVVGMDEDENGRYYITKGDNNPSADPGRVRFGDINGVVVAVVY